MTTTRRRIARLLATTAVGGALVAGAATTASAATSTDAPPAQSVAAPAASAIPAVGDAGQDYWASDTCHYFLQAGTWWSDMCFSGILDEAGNVVPDFVSAFQNLGNGQLGREVLRLYFGTPGYVAFAPVTDVVGEWQALPLGDPAPNQVQGMTIDGQPVVVTVITPPSTQQPGTGTYPPGLTGAFLQWRDSGILTAMAQGNIGFINTPTHLP
jgi:hypothetical protein